MALILNNSLMRVQRLRRSTAVETIYLVCYVGRAAVTQQAGATQTLKGKAEGLEARLAT